MHYGSILIFPYANLQFKESVAQFAQENIAPHAEKIDKTNYFPQVHAISALVLRSILLTRNDIKPLFFL